MKKIVLALDFEWQSNKLLAAAKQYALAFHSQLHIVHVSTLPTNKVNFNPMEEDSANANQAELNAERRLLAQLCSNLKDEGVETDFSIVEGDVSTNLLRQAENIAAELIIVGHHKKGFLMRALLKSTSEEALQKTKIPILAIPLEF
jgi:nucleotide-binding universal stress UspA family protein